MNRLGEGVVFYLNGNKYNHLVPPCLHSLQQNWDGRIHIVLDGDVESYLEEALVKLPRVSVSWFNEVSEGLDTKYKGIKNIWLKKAMCHKRHYPFRLNLYYDFDHTFHNKIHYSIFDMANQSGLACSCYNRVSRKSGRIVPKVKEQFDVDLPYFMDVNGGCVCVDYSSPAFAKWMEYMDAMETCDDRTFTQNPEERALAMTICAGWGVSVPDYWSRTVQEGEVIEKFDGVALHYSRSRYYTQPLWWLAVKNALAANYMGYRDNYTTYIQHANRGEMLKCLTTLKQDTTS